MPHLDEAGDHFHMMMGDCIAEWAHIEDYFFMICHATLQCPQQQAAVVYYKTPHLDTRMTLSDELVELVLPQHRPSDQKHEDLRAWIDVYRVVDKLKPVRNRIAHCQSSLNAGVLRTYGAGEATQTESWFLLYESYYQRLRGKLVDPPIFLKDLQSHLVAVNRAKSALHVFYYDRLSKHVSVSTASAIISALVGPTSNDASESNASAPASIISGVISNSPVELPLGCSAIGGYPERPIRGDGVAHKSCWPVTHLPE